MIDRHANVNAENKAGWTPLMKAFLRVTDGSKSQEQFFHEVIRLFLEHDASVRVQTHKDGFTPLMGAIFSGDDPELMKMILVKKPDVDAATKDDATTPLMFAATYGYLDIVQLLVEANAKLNLRDIHGKTALDCAMPDPGFDTPAKRAKKAAVAAYLKSKGAL